MAFGDKEHKKSPFEKITLIVVLVMVLVMLAGLILPAINVIF